jgi:hypothetical protein
MRNLQEFIETQLVQARAYFSKTIAMEELQLAPQTFQAAITWLTKQGRLVSPRRGFYLILRPEDRLLGAPDSARWIDPSMNHVGLDYRRNSQIEGSGFFERRRRLRTQGKLKSLQQSLSQLLTGFAFTLKSG